MLLGWQIAPPAKLITHSLGLFIIQSSRDCCEFIILQSPAEWLVFNGGKSCAAPGEYAGPCAVVL